MAKNDEARVDSTRRWRRRPRTAWDYDHSILSAIVDVLRCCRRRRLGHPRPWSLVIAGIRRWSSCSSPAWSSPASRQRPLRLLERPFHHRRRRPGRHHHHQGAAPASERKRAGRSRRWRACRRHGRHRQAASLQRGGPEPSRSRLLPRARRGDARVNLHRRPEDGLAVWWKMPARLLNWAVRYRRLPAAAGPRAHGRRRSTSAAAPSCRAGGATCRGGCRAARRPRSPSRRCPCCCTGRQPPAAVPHPKARPLRPPARLAARPGTARSCSRACRTPSARNPPTAPPARAPVSGRRRRSVTPAEPAAGASAVPSGRQPVATAQLDRLPVRARARAQPQVQARPQVQELRLPRRGVVVGGPPRRPQPGVVQGEALAGRRSAVAVDGRYPRRPRDAARQEAAAVSAARPWWRRGPWSTGGGGARANRVEVARGLPDCGGGRGLTGRGGRGRAWGGREAAADQPSTPPPVERPCRRRPWRRRRACTRAPRPARRCPATERTSCTSCTRRRHVRRVQPQPAPEGRRGGRPANSSTDTPVSPRTPSYGHS